MKTAGDAHTPPSAAAGHQHPSPPGAAKLPRATAPTRPAWPNSGRKRHVAMKRVFLRSSASARYRRRSFTPCTNTPNTVPATAAPAGITNPHHCDIGTPYLGQRVFLRPPARARRPPCPCRSKCKSRCSSRVLLQPQAALFTPSFRRGLPSCAAVDRSLAPGPSPEPRTLGQTRRTKATNA